MGMVMGTLGYIAPKQISCEAHIDIRADIYALGTVLYFMSTGEAAYEGSSSEVVMHKQFSSLPDPLDRNKLKDFEAALLQPVIEKAMQFKPELRYQYVGSFIIVKHAKGESVAVSSEDIATGEATRYSFVYKGELNDGFTLQSLIFMISFYDDDQTMIFIRLNK